MGHWQTVQSQIRRRRTRRLIRFCIVCLQNEIETYYPKLLNWQWIRPFAKGGSFHCINVLKHYMSGFDLSTKVQIIHCPRHKSLKFGQNE